MTDYKSMKVMRVLGGYETSPQALYVGGCVRNNLLEKPVTDIDIATVHPPLEVIEKLKAAGIRYVPTGLDHGTVTAIVDDGTFEITTLRRDIDTNGRYAVIAFTKEWEEDAQRRDFTINTLLASPDGTIYDPIGTGIDDVDKRHIVFVGEAEQRIAEDYLRILRFFRFYAQYGQGEPDKAALAACKAAANKISSLSKERITQEFFKIIAVPNPAPLLDLMFAHDVLADMAKGYKSAQMINLCDMQARYDAFDVMARLIAVSGMDVNYFEDRLVLSNAQKKRVDTLAEGTALLNTVSKKKVRQLVYRVGNAAALQSYFLYLSKKDQLPDIELIEIARYWQPPVFSIKAEELIEAGVSQGPALGKTLKDLEEKWIAKDFPANFAFKKK
jgi:poly(A) polymerase